MSRMPRAGGRYVQPIDSSGVLVPPDTTGNAARGVYPLAAGQTYYYILGGPDAPIISGHITAYASAAAANGLIITSATVQDCDHSELDVTNFSSTVGEWVDEDPSSAFVGADGTGWSATNGVLAATGAGLGGARFNVADTAAYRTRVKVVVGATGGPLRVSSHGKM
jgi:hypothetical protein